MRTCILSHEIAPDRWCNHWGSRPELFTTLSLDDFAAAPPAQQIGESWWRARLDCDALHAEVSR